MKLKTFTTLDVALIHEAAAQQGGAAANQKAVLGVGVLLLLLLHHNRPVYHLTWRGSPWSVTRLSGVSPRRRVGATLWWVRAGLRWRVSTRLGVGCALVLTWLRVAGLGWVPGLLGRIRGRITRLGRGNPLDRVLNRVWRRGRR